MIQLVPVPHQGSPSSQAVVFSHRHLAALLIVNRHKGRATKDECLTVIDTCSPQDGCVEQHIHDL